MTGGLRNNFVGKAFYTGVGFHEKTLDNVTEPINTEQFTGKGSKGSALY